VSEPGVSSGASLLALCHELVAVASPSRHEAPLADFVESRLRSSGLSVARIGDNLVASGEARPGPRLLFAGHLDTVPLLPTGTGARLDGDRCFGRGAVDMKGGLAVLLDLADELPRLPAVVDVTFVFYAREEVQRSESGLAEVAAHDPELLRADAAVVAEPTGGVVEGGCQGVLRASVTLGGRAAHVARPWMGQNALHRLAPVIERVASAPLRTPEISGCRFRESLQAVAASAGVGTNVVPPEARCTLSYRFAPDRSPLQAEAWLRELLGDLLHVEDGDRFEVEDVAPGALPGFDSPLLASLVELSGSAPRAKLGWTDVAFLGELGVPAANFGPGDPELAHQDEEWVDGAELERVRDVLVRLVSAGAG
jgi:succinyl-diaminopimelate desuccinylase